MNTARPLAELFPRLDEIPAAYQPDAPVEQRDYLLDGELRQWHGPLAEVRSQCSCARRTAASAGRTRQHAAAGCRRCARGAGCGGRGVRQRPRRPPTMRVAERIAHVEAFSARMREQREAVVKLPDVEIGKNLKDSEKEFDRTCDYIVDTIHALKELDRSSSRFELEQGTLGQIRRAPMGVALCMGPYNYPLNETFTTLIPALIMGNTVVFKPAKFGVLLIRPLLEAFRDSPGGVINVIYGRGRETVSADGQRQGRRVRLYRHAQGRRRPEETAPASAPPARRAGAGCEEPGIVLPQVDLDNAVEEAVTGAVVQRPALHRAEDPLRA